VRLSQVVGFGAMLVAVGVAVVRRGRG
jgi:hypothetical protein